MPIAVWAIVRMTWGASIRKPMVSAGGPSYKLPPPSTIIGALARGLARLKGWGELVYFDRSVYSPAYLLARHLLAAGAGLLEGSLSPVNLTTRYLAVPYLRSSNRRERKQWFSVQGMGYIVTGDARLCIAAVFDNGITDIASPGELELSAASILSLGSKEGLVSVEDYGVKAVGETAGGASGFYAPVESVKSARRGVVEVYWDPRDYRAYTRTRMVAHSRLTVIVPVKYDRNGAIIGHGGNNGYFLQIAEDYPSYKIPGSCGDLPALPKRVSGGVRE